MSTNITFEPKAPLTESEVEKIAQFWSATDSEGSYILSEDYIIALKDTFGFPLYTRMNPILSDSACKWDIVTPRVNTPISEAEAIAKIRSSSGVDICPDGEIMTRLEPSQFRNGSTMYTYKSDTVKLELLVSRDKLSLECSLITPEPAREGSVTSNIR